MMFHALKSTVSKKTASSISALALTCHGGKFCMVRSLKQNQTENGRGPLFYAKES